MTAEHKDYFHKSGKVSIGNRNIIREFTTINSGTHATTLMGNDCLMLRGSHLSHDSTLEDSITISCNVLIGGESYIMEGANLGLGAILHQRTIVGAYSMIGMGTIVTKKTDIIPGNIYCGNPAQFMKRNVVGLHRARIDSERIIKEMHRYETLRYKRSSSL